MNRPLIGTSNDDASSYRRKRLFASKEGAAVLACVLY